MANTIVFNIDGGLGKNIMATAVLKAIKKQYQKANIVVVTGYPDVFIANPNVNKVIQGGQQTGLYSKYIENKDAKVFISDPYHTSDYITESKHLLEIWCDMYGVKYNGEMPELFLSKAEKQYFEPFYKLDKPIMAIQPHGGAIGQPLMYSWTRDIPQTIMQDIIDYFKDDYAILHIKRQDQLMYPNTIGALDEFRSIAILLTLSKKRLLIDSSAMHIATALKLPSVVTWVTTNPKVFGYDMHDNILAKEPTKKVDADHPYFVKNLLFEDISKIPYNDLNEIFDKKQIINSLKLTQ
jgi:ADP-heptose:LPS heptosyltransferase